MNGAREFGRRQTPPKDPARTAVPEDPIALTPEAETFRQSLGAAFAERPDAFSAWWRGQTTSRLLMRLLNLALLSPGLLCAALGAGYGVSAVAETLGVGLAFWLRRERRRRLHAIAAWSDDGETPGAKAHDAGAWNR